MADATHPSFYLLYCMANKEHMSPITRMERCVELIEEMRTHPFQQEIIQLAKEQLEDMFTYDVVKQR